VPDPRGQALGLILAVISGCRCAAPQQAGFAERMPQARGVAYAAEVHPGLYRGGTPDAEGIAWLRSLGVRTVVNLRHYHGDTEGAALHAAGMRYERIPLESSDAPEPEKVERFLAIVTDPAARPIYVHCLHGVDRTGAMMAVYRMEVDGWPAARAIAEMEHFGPHALWRDLSAFVRDYRPTGRWRASGAGP